MHRIPLKLSSPSVYWNRNLSECFLFENTLNHQNIRECECFLDILDKEADEFFKLKSKRAVEDFNSMRCTGKTEDRLLLNTIILQSPKDCAALPQALKCRANWNLQKCCFEDAINDFKMFLYTNMCLDDYEDLCEVHGNLAISYYLLRKYDFSRKCLRIYYKYKVKLPRECFLKSKLGNIDSHICNFCGELNDFTNVAPRCDDSLSQSIPFNGFSNDKEIKQMSSACYIESRRKRKKSGVFLKTDIPKASVVLLEKPICTSLNAPLTQCELCLRICGQVYNCLECRYKTYCSLECIEEDKHIHKYECSAYRNLILLILDAKDLFRLFLQLSIHLQENVFAQKVFRKLVSASAVFEKIEHHSDYRDFQISASFDLLRVRPSYKKLSQMQFSTLVATAFRLTIFISVKTNIVDTFYKKLRISHAQKTILIGAILMRLHCNILLNSFDFEYDIPLLAEKPMYNTLSDQLQALVKLMKPKMPTNAANINEYYNIAEAEVVDLAMRYLDHGKENLDQFTSGSIPILQHIMLCDLIVRPISIFKDKLTELYFNPDEVEFLVYGDMSATPTFSSASNIFIAEMSYNERCKFVQMFTRNFHNHFIAYFSQISVRFNQIHQVLSLQCPSLSKFKHSCVPNADIVVLENGLVIVRTLQNVRSGEELVVSYKAHYLRHTREGRRSFLKKINIHCECKACISSAKNEPTDFRLGVYCESCREHEITPTQVNCTNCGINYSTLLLKYRREMKMLEDVVRGLITPKTDERRLHLFNTILYMRAKNYFVPANETRVKSELAYARYLALKDFVQQAYSVLMEVESNISRHYKETELWLTFYPEVLLIIKIILYYNLDKTSNPMSSVHLEELCKFGIHIIKTQLSHIFLNKRYIDQYTELFQEFQLFLKWKERIYCLTLQKNIPSSNNRQSVNSAGESFLPGLLKSIT